MQRTFDLSLCLPSLLLLALVAGATGCSDEPTSADPIAGSTTTSLLARFDAVDSTPPGVHLWAVEIGGEERAAIFAHAPSTVHFRDLKLGRRPLLRFGIGIHPAGVPSDGVAFLVRLRTGDEEHVVWSRELIPGRDGSRWVDVEVALDAFAGRVVDLALVTRIRDNPDADRSLWSTPVLEDLAAGPSASPVRAWRLAQRLDVTGVQRIAIGPDHVLELAGEAVTRARRVEPPAPEVRFRALADDEVIFERKVRASVHVNSFGDRVSLAPFAGRSVDIRFEIEAPEEIEGLDAHWLQAAVLRQEVRSRQVRGKAPNLLFVVVDTLRSDRLASYGSARPTSPHFDRLAADGVLFEQAISPSSWTMPATASLLTGLYPTEHRVSDGQPLVLELETIAERAQALGMTTLGISANPIVGRAEGFAQGHEHFIHLPWARAESLNPLLVQLLREASASRWYAYVHYIDPHDPYDAPPPFGTRYLSDYHSPFAEKAGFAKLVDAVNFGRGEVDYDERDLDYLRAAYDGEISYWDAQFGRLLAQLTALGLLRNTIVVVTSDHGEEFLEHGRIKHGLHLYEESVRVPLLIYAPHLYPAVRRSEPVETRLLADLFSRLLSSPPPSTDEMTHILRPRRDMIFSHTTHGMLGHGFGRTPLVAIRDTEWKLIHYPEGHRQELYSLARDAGEREELSEQEAQTATEYFDILERWMRATSRESDFAAGPQNEAVLEKLRSLGYIQ